MSNRSGEERRALPPCVEAVVAYLTLFRLFVVDDELIDEERAEKAESLAA